MKEEEGLSEQSKEIFREWIEEDKDEIVKLMERIKSFESLIGDKENKKGGKEQ